MSSCSLLRLVHRPTDKNRTRASTGDWRRSAGVFGCSISAAGPMSTRVEVDIRAHRTASAGQAARRSVFDLVEAGSRGRSRRRMTCGSAPERSKFPVPTQCSILHPGSGVRSENKKRTRGVGDAHVRPSALWKRSSRPARLCASGQQPPVGGDQGRRHRPNPGSAAVTARVRSRAGRGAGDPPRSLP